MHLKMHQTDALKYGIFKMYNLVTFFTPIHFQVRKTDSFFFIYFDANVN